VASSWLEASPGAPRMAKPEAELEDPALASAYLIFLEIFGSLLQLGPREEYLHIGRCPMGAACWSVPSDSLQIGQRLGQRQQQQQHHADEYEYYVPQVAARRIAPRPPGPVESVCLGKRLPEGLAVPQ
jgi:hypothetical protein